MKYLYFINNRNEYIFICPTEMDKYYQDIKSFIFSKNPNFKIYYMRSWREKEGLMLDVGSHTEFFLLADNKLTF